MNVKNAKDRIKRIEKICNEAYIRHSEDQKTPIFMLISQFFYVNIEEYLQKQLTKQNCHCKRFSIAQKTKTALYMTIATKK